MTPREYELRWEGYVRTKREQWELTRMHALKLALLWIDPKKLGAFDLYEWFPSPYDPTGAEKKEIEQERKRQEAERIKKIYNERLTQMQKAGMK